MSDRSRPFIWVLAAFFTAAAIAGITLDVAGTGKAGTDQALRATARFSFLLFWPAYAGGALHRLSVPLLAAFGGLRRQFGLGFAAAHSVHVLLICWLYHIGSLVSTDVLIVDGIGIIGVYLLVILSIDNLRHAFGPVAMRVLFNLGLEYIAFVFLSDFLLSALTRVLNRLPVVHDPASDRRRRALVSRSPMAMDPINYSETRRGGRKSKASKQPEHCRTR
jgi:hypothetical protein